MAEKQWVSGFSLVISPYLRAYLVESFQMVCLFHPAIQWPVISLFLTQKTSASSRGVETKDSVLSWVYEKKVLYLPIP